MRNERTMRIGDSRGMGPSDDAEICFALFPVQHLVGRLLPLLLHQRARKTQVTRSRSMRDQRD
eukprot:3170184-Rhodomonas_salina.2